jgi:WD40 repeat protein
MMDSSDVRGEAGTSVRVVSDRWTFRACVLAVALLATGAASADAPKAPTLIGNGMGQVTFLRYSPNGKELARICQFGSVELFATERYDRMRTFEIGMRMVAFNPDGSQIATAEGTDGARVWDASLPGKKFPSPEPPEAGVTEVYVLEKPLRVLEVPSSAGTNSLETRADLKRVLRAEFSPDGKRLLTAQASGHVKVWRTDTWVTEAELTATDGGLSAAAFAPDGKTVIVGGADGVLHEWSLEQKKEVKTVRAPGAVTEIAFAPDGSTMATVHQTETGSSVLFWDKARQLVETKAGWSSVGISKDGKTMAIGGTRVEFIDPASRKTLRAVELPAITMAESNPAFAKEPGADTKIPISVVALAFSPDGTTLAAGCQDGSIRLVQTAP